MAISGSLQRSAHDIEPFSTISALDDSPAQRSIKTCHGFCCVQIKGGMTQLARMRFDGSDEHRTEAAAPMIGFDEQCAEIGPVSGPVLGFGFVQRNRPNDDPVRNGDERCWKSVFTEVPGQPPLNGLKGRICIRPPLPVNPLGYGWQMLRLVAEGYDLTGHDSSHSNAVIPGVVPGDSAEWVRLAAFAEASAAQGASPGEAFKPWRRRVAGTSPEKDNAKTRMEQTFQFRVKSEE